MNLRPRYLDSEPTSRWMVSYVDMVTILLILFVAMAAQSLHNVRSTLTIAAEPVRTAEVSPATRDSSPLLSPALADAREKLLRQNLNLRIEPRGLVISLPQTILFPSGQDQVSPSALPVVSQIADVLHEIPNKVSLIGHADSVPIHNHRFGSNWELSVARGLKLRELLSERYGIADSRLSIASYGSYNPTESNDTEHGRAKNRRVEIVILNESAERSQQSRDLSPDSNGAVP